MVPYASSRSAAFPAWVLAVAFLPGLLNLFPQIEGWLDQNPPRRIFLGFRHNYPDALQYMALAEQYRQRAVPALDNPFITEPQKPRYVMLYLGAVALISYLGSLDLVLSWYVLSLLACWFFFLICWRYIAAVYPEGRQRRDAFLALCLGSGVVWIGFGLHGMGLLPFPFSSEEIRFLGNWTAFNASRRPMQMAAYALVVGVLIRGVRQIQNDSRTQNSPIWKRLTAAFASGMCLIAAFFVHPYTGLAGLALVAAQACLPLCWRMRDGHNAPGRWLSAGADIILSCCIAGLGIAIYALWTRQDEAYVAVAAQIADWRTSYGIWWFLPNYGLVLLFGIPGLFVAIRSTSRNAALKFLPLWFSVAVVLAQFPLLPGVKFQPLVFVPLAMAFASGLDAARRRWGARISPSRRRLLAFLLWSGLILGSVMDVLSVAPTWLYSDPLQETNQPTLDLLAELRSLEDGNVLASTRVGPFVPWMTDKHVFFGHWFMSYGADHRRQLLQSFSSPTVSLEWKKAFVRAQRIRYLVESDDFQPVSRGHLPGASLQFRNAVGSIYSLSQADAD